EPSELENTPSEWLDRIHADDKENVLAALDAHRQGKTAHFESEHRVRHKGGDYIWVLCRGLAIMDEAGNPARMAGSQTDITLRKLFEEQLRHQALHDSLTSLPNRALFLDRVQQAIKTSERDEESRFAVMFLDLDRFKVLNDGLGHVVGDMLLNMFAQKLQDILRAVDTVCRHGGTLARFGGDEFVMLLDNISGVGDATLVAGRIERVLKEPFLIEGNEVFTSASIGIAMSGPGYTNAEELIRNADTAMYRAKAQGKACFEIFDSDMHSKAIERLQLENDLRRAIERDEFCLFYQPIVSLETGRIIAFEALVRWEHPERGMVSPIDFIPIAEETGMILPIGEKVLQESCRQLKAWQDTLPSYRELRISVNLSVKEFSKPNLIGSIVDALTAVNLDPQFLKLEITESALMESVDLVTRILRQIRDMNIQLSIDDFGTGYSSLSYLHRFPMNTLKVDQAFIRDMMTSKESGQIVKTVILLAEALSMSTIAEGIEAEEQALILRDLKCEAGQGYFFAKPLPSAEATALLESDPVWLKDCGAP
ncbi:MAG: EAL domain-containing protein, partial [Candidatus Hydrogenedentes bacterium]|nr:EAL domain-containing protein [Candidatus Hydrogenedentota bacterium]